MRNHSSSQAERPSPMRALSTRRRRPECRAHPARQARDADAVGAEACILETPPPHPPAGRSRGPVQREVRAMTRMSPAPTGGVADRRQCTHSGARLPPASALPLRGGAERGARPCAGEPRNSRQEDRQNARRGLNIGVADKPRASMGERRRCALSANRPPAACRSLQVEQAGCRRGPAEAGVVEHSGARPPWHR